MKESSQSKMYTDGDQIRILSVHILRQMNLQLANIFSKQKLISKTKNSQNGTQSIAMDNLQWHSLDQKNFKKLITNSYVKKVQK